MTAAAVVDLACCALEPIERVGGKALGLGRLLERSLDVPPGFVVTTDAYRAFVAEHGLGERIARILAGAVGVAGERDAALAIEALFATVALESEAIDAAYLALSAGGSVEPAVAVRSSATAEDGADASYAGQQDSHLWIRGAREVRRHIVACWGSLFSAPAISYRRRIGAGEDDAAMAVVVQVMVAAQSAGVMFTIDPVTGDPSQITIEGTVGLGLPLVGGEITPDRYSVDKVTLEIRSRTIATKPFADRAPERDGPVMRVALDDEQASASSLSDDEVVALARLGKELERSFGTAVDVEWAFGDGPGGSRQLALLQARPETVWRGGERRAPGTARTGTVLDRIAAAVRTSQGPSLDG